jgi:hypothetical protein
VVYGAYCSLLARSTAMSHIAWQKACISQSIHVPHSMVVWWH